MVKKCTCKNNRWKTVKKENGIRKIVACRKCGHERTLTAAVKNQQVIDELWGE